MKINRAMLKRWIVRFVLLAILVISLFRFVGFVVQFGNESIQMDFSASYTAAESLNAGLSPYENHLKRDPPIWDGVCLYKHSRFTYTPLVAFVTRPLALLSYKHAKHVWMLILLVSVFISLFIAVHISGIQKSSELFLGLGIFTCLFFPLLAELERGQIDAINLLLIMISMYFMLKKGNAQLVAGVMLALATFFKLYCIFLIPFLVLRRKWKVLAGYLVGMVLFLIVSFIACGSLCNDYWSKHLPRISQYQEEGTEEMLLSPPITVPLYLKYTKTPHEMTVKDGRYYNFTVFRFTHNATLVKALRDTRVGKSFYDWLEKIGLGHHQDSSLALALLGTFIISLILLLLKYFKSNTALSPFQELIYWQIVLIVIVLSGVRTWAMNTVWFMPASIILFYGYKTQKSKGVFFYLCLCALGLIIAAMTDAAFLRVIPFSSELLLFKYIIAGLLMFISLVLLLRAYLCTKERASNIRL
ncbi:glycosyltransferase family 87 protein [Candidatus Omnitrophota bacterium]